MQDVGFTSKPNFRLLNTISVGNWLPIAQVRDDVAAGYRQEVEWKKKKNLLPYQQNLKAQKVPNAHHFCDPMSN